MSSVVIAGNTSGTVTLQAPAVAGTTTINLPSNSGVAITDYNTPAYRNRLINGAMVIDQRNAGAAITPTANSYITDRWTFALGGTPSSFTLQQNAGGVTPPTGFTNYLGATVVSTAGFLNTYRIVQYIEGYNIADLGWGTANAKTVTLSFWVRSSLTGTFGGVISNNGAARSYPFTYAISAANTWEYKTITIPGDTSGTWLTTNGAGMAVAFSLGETVTYKGTPNVWASATYFSATGTIDLASTLGATFYITGVQLEKGSSATAFDTRSYGTELVLCQRYYYRWTNDTAVNIYPFPMSAYATTAVYGKILDLPVTMRANPTCSTSGTFTGMSSAGVATTAFTSTFIQGQKNSLSTTAWTGSSGMTQGNCVCVQVSNNAWVDASAEL